MVERPLRADARRNRERLIETALEEFTRERSGGEVTMEAIAKKAGVGIGTLYRHFPTREVLIDVVYHTELGKLCDAASQLLVEYAPEKATREWMDLFVEYMATKQGMADALKAVIASGADPFSGSRDRLVGAVTTLLDAAELSGVEPLDVLTTVGGVALAANDQEQAGRMLDLVMDGLRHRGSGQG
ncbi:TetR/AcrR family transcriptional regulator [Actinosynnema sp. NPDC020468]|uniref:TetR/AcrR family transcriptional regulator n=1 Tax=Actinosynnema sp. NPDC020468 TaxID=3154488 RepID=UPI003401B42A